MDCEKKYCELGQFFGCYVHQDWPDESGTLENCVKLYITESMNWADSRGPLLVCYENIKDIIKESHTNEEWESIIYDAFGCCYSYTYHGLTARQFLETIQELMRKHAWEIRKFRLE